MLKFSEQPAFEHICSFLSNRDRAKLLSTSKKLATNWLPKLRVVALSEEYVVQFLTDAEFRELILSLIIAPIKQLELFYEGESDFLTAQKQLKDLQCAGLHRLECSTDFFDMLMSKVKKGNFETIDCLELTAGEGDSFKSVKQLSRAQTSLHLTFTGSFPKQLKSLAPSLQGLSLSYDPNFNDEDEMDAEDEPVGCSITLPPLPQLLKLALTNVMVENFSDFVTIKELVLDYSPFSTLPPFFNQIPNLTLKNCSKLMDLTPLQDNYQVSIENCGATTDFSRCFRNSSIINIICDNSTEVPNMEDDEEVPMALPAMTIHVDLFHYKRCREFSLHFEADLLLATGTLSSRAEVSPFLKKVTLNGLRDTVPLSIFGNVKELVLENISADLSLAGLDTVATVTLSNLSELSSLEGLGHNQKVTIDNCNKLVDFSPVRTVNTVEIFFCRGFRDVSQVDHVRHLRIGDCLFLEDVSRLATVASGGSHPMQSLTIRSCNRIRSIEGLTEVIPEVTCIACRNLRKYNNNLKSKKTFSTLATSSNRLLSLPDSLYSIIFSYLYYHDQISVLLTSSYLYYVLMPRFRRMEIDGEQVFEFFTDKFFAKEVLEKIENPYEQLQVSDQEQVLGIDEFQMEDIPVDLPLVGFQQLEIRPEVFLFLCQERGNAAQDWFVKDLTLLGPGDEDEIFNYQTLFPYLYKARETLTFETMFLGEGFENHYFAPTLRELIIKHILTKRNDEEDEDEEETENGFLLPVIPQLQTLWVTNSQITNLQDFHYLQGVTLENIPDLESVESFSAVREIHLLDLPELSDISGLQGNEIVEITACPLITKFTHCFPKVKQLIIRLSDDWEFAGTKIALDLSHFPELQEFQLEGYDIGYDFVTKKQRQQLCSTDQLPPSLKKVTLKGLKHFSNTKIFHSLHLHYVYLNSCPSITSVEGLGLVKVLVLRQLENLSSLQGLLGNPSSTTTSTKKKKDHTATPGSSRNQQVIVEACEKITDFSPLRFIPQVSIIECPGLTNGHELDGVKMLNLRDCPNITDISMLTQAKSLYVVRCEAVETIGNVPDIVPAFHHY